MQVATEKQKRFAKLVANGCDKDGSPITATDAYVEAGYKELLPRHSQRVEASRLVASDTVSQLIEEEMALIKKFENKIQKNQEILILSDSQRVLDKLRTWIDGDIEASTSQLRSAELLARISGMLRTDISIETKERSSSEIKDLLTSKLASLSEIGVVEENQEDEEEEEEDEKDERTPISSNKEAVH